MYFFIKFIAGFVVAGTLVISLMFGAGYQVVVPWTQEASVVGANASLMENDAETFPPNPASSVYVDPQLILEERKKANEPRVTFAVLGDVMLARGVDKVHADKWHSLFNGLGGTPFSGLHGVIANLEGVFMETPDRSNPRTFSFHFDTESVRALTSAGITHVSLANNHSDNGGKAGTDYTHGLLDLAGIEWFGGYDTASPKHVGVVKGKDLDLVVIGVNLVYKNDVDIVDIVAEHAAKPRTRVLVFPHWGEEYADKANAQQRTLAHSWVDAGADLVVGAHTHSVQNMEVHRGVPIIYSLGNAVFDQDWSQETSEGLIVVGEFTEDSLRLKGIPIEIKKGAPVFASDEASLRVFERVDYQLSSTQAETFIQPGAAAEVL